MKYSKLEKAVIDQLKIDSEQELIDICKDVCNHGADAGWHGFIYHTETLAFSRKHKKAILESLEAMAADIGEDMLTCIGSFNCLSDGRGAKRVPIYTNTEIAQAIWQGKGEAVTPVLNALAWYALETVANDIMNKLEG
jgi:hypothetical protein